MAVRAWALGTVAALALSAVPALGQTPVTADPGDAVPPAVAEPLADPAADVFDGPAPDLGEPPAETAPPPLAEGEIEFSAERIVYDSDADTVTASGRVRLQRDGNRVQADEVVWDRRTGRVIASGQVVGVGPTGDTLYGERLDLTDSLRDGMVENLLLVLSDGSRLAANSGTRTDGVYRLDRAIYTACPVTTIEGCPRRPSWSLTAVAVTYDQGRRRLRFRGARLNLFNAISLPLPGLATTTGGGSASGLLQPDLNIDRSNGIEISQPYYWRIAPNRELTVTPHAFSAVLPMLEGEYRSLTANGAYRLAAQGTFSRLIPLRFGGSPDSRQEFRGGIDGNGRFVLSPDWVVSGSVRRTTDRTFLRRYDISRDTRLRSVLQAERFGEDSYLSIAGWAAQELRLGFDQGQQPLAVPAVDGRLRVPRLLGSDVVTLRVNTLGLLRSEGQDTARAFAEAKWQRRSITTLGQELTLTGLVRGDVYATRDTAANPVPLYRGEEGVTGRGIALVAADLQWPFAGPLGDGTQRITPRVQLVATPPITNTAIPNEDSRGFELEDVNIFSLNRFPGNDRFEDGARLTVGVDYRYTRPGLSIDSTVGQSFRLTDKPSLFPDGTGLTDRVSDYVARTTVRWRDFVALTHRIRLDHADFTVRRNEVDLTAGTARTYVTAGYLRLNRNLLIEDLEDVEEARVGARVAFARYWSAFGSAVVDLTGRSEDPLSRSDGFQPVRHRLGILYDDECLALGLTWRRTYVTQGDSRSGNSFGLTVSLRNLGR